MGKTFDWTVRYEDKTTIYEDGYECEQYAKEYAEEARSDGYKNVTYYKKNDH